jgi:hypothetical protein
MPITILQLREEGPLLAFETINNQIDFKNTELLKQEGLEEGDLVIAKYLVDKNMNPVSEKQYAIAKCTEEEFHSELRVQAAEKKHLITSHSTDAEWSPENYSKNLNN